jgi:hypothetical protein
MKIIEVQKPEIHKETSIGRKYQELLKEFGLRTGKADNQF